MKNILIFAFAFVNYCLCKGQNDTIVKTKLIDEIVINNKPV